MYKRKSKIASLEIALVQVSQDNIEQTQNESIRSKLNLPMINHVYLRYQQ